MRTCAIMHRHKGERRAGRKVAHGCLLVALGDKGERSISALAAGALRKDYPTPIAKVLLGTGTRPYFAVRVTGTARVRGSQARGLHDRDRQPVGRHGRRLTTVWGGKLGVETCAASKSSRQAIAGQVVTGAVPKTKHMLARALEPANDGEYRPVTGGDELLSQRYIHSLGIQVCRDSPLVHWISPSQAAYSPSLSLYPPSLDAFYTLC